MGIPSSSFTLISIPCDIRKCTMCMFWLLIAAKSGLIPLLISAPLEIRCSITIGLFCLHAKKRGVFLL